MSLCRKFCIKHNLFCLKSYKLNFVYSSFKFYTSSPYQPNCQSETWCQIFKKKMLLFKEQRVAASLILRDVFQTVLGLLQSPSYNDTQGLDWGRQLLVLTVSEDLRSIPLLGVSWDFYWIKLELGEFAELQKCPNLFLKDWYPFCSTKWDRELRGKNYLNK